MKSINITIETINDVKELVAIANTFDFDIDLVSGRYAVDAKSIMGILSLDLAKPIKVNIHCDDADDFLNQIEKFKAVE